MDKKFKDKIANMEKILPQIERKLAGQKIEQEEYDSLKLQMDLLKKDFNNVENKYIKLQDEITKTNKRTVKLYLKMEPSPLIRITKNIRQIWRNSKALFLIILILIVMLVPMGIFYQNNLIQNLSFDIGFIIITLILYIRFPKYRLLTSMFLLAIFIFIFANFKDDESMQWTLISTAIAIIALGLSLQAFSSDEFTEQKLSKIDTIEKKLDEVIKRFPESPNINNQSSGIIVKKDKKKKNL
jgi:hypothetical protein